LGEAARLQADSPDVLNATAWILATCPDARHRNPEAAVRLAERANELTGYGSAGGLDTLAAAYASAGRFDQAEASATKALDQARKGGDSRLVDQIHRRRELYELQKPFFDSAPSKEAAR
jgi:hypothetical protein